MPFRCSGSFFLTSHSSEWRVREGGFGQRAKVSHYLLPSLGQRLSAGFPCLGHRCRFFRMVTSFQKDQPSSEYVLQLISSESLFSSRSARHFIHSVFIVGALLSGLSAWWLKDGHFLGVTLAHWKLPCLVLSQGKSAVYFSLSLSLNHAVYLQSIFSLSLQFIFNLFSPILSLSLS